MEMRNGLPGTLGLLFLSAVNGSPTMTRIARFNFGPDGNVLLSADVPNDPGLSGTSFSMLGFALFLEQPENRTCGQGIIECGLSAAVYANAQG